MRYTALLAIAFVVLGSFAYTRSISYSEESASEIGYWKNLIETKGGPAAYADFKKEYSGKKFKEQHLTAHVIGAQLYENEGIDGLSVCDHSFAFGCYHGFFGRAVADKGAPIVPILAQACKQKFGDSSTGCEHGIGHGVMEHLGPEGLLEGLTLCKLTDQKNLLFGCTGGLFMEYNTPIDFIGGAHVTVRPMDPDNVLAPCNTLVPQEFRASCYFEIALWWKYVFGAEYEKIGNACALADTRDERSACWKGWGTVVAEESEYDVARAASICALIDDADGAGFCKLGAAMRFFGTQTEISAGRAICEQLGGPFRAECLSLDPLNDI